jgi:thiamine phosphate synthase YjbQ (UPF0047 family)
MQFIDITEAITQIVRQACIRNGLVNVQTTAI